MNDEARILITRLLEEHIRKLDNLIREQTLLSEPCPAGHWRWADIGLDGYTHLTEEELATKQRRAATRVTEFCEELAVAELARTEITS